MGTKEIPINDVAYLERLVRCNTTVGGCLAIRILSAEEYERAAYALAHPEEWPFAHPEKWPGDAVEKVKEAVALARTPPLAAEFGWLVRLFDDGKPGGRCPVWEQAAADLYDCETYRNFVYRRTKSYLPPVVRGSEDGGLSPRDRAVEKFAYVLWDLYRLVVGWAAEMLRRHRAGEIPGGRSWLDAALYRAGDVVGQGVRGEATGVRRRPDKPKQADEPRNAKTDRTRASLVGDGTELESAPSREEPSDTVAENTDRDRLLRERVAALPEPERTVLRLRYFEEKTLEDIAAVLGISTHRVRQYLERARRTLRAELPDGNVE